MKSKNQKDKPVVVPKPKAKVAPARKWGVGGGGAPADKPAVLQLRGNKWCIENQKGMVTLEADRVSTRQTVYIYACADATIILNGKVVFLPIYVYEGFGLLLCALLSVARNVCVLACR